MNPIQTLGGLSRDRVWFFPSGVGNGSTYYVVVHCYTSRPYYQFISFLEVSVVVEAKSPLPLEKFGPRNRKPPFFPTSKIYSPSPYDGLRGHTKYVVKFSTSIQSAASFSASGMGILESVLACSLAGCFLCPSFRWYRLFAHVSFMSTRSPVCTYECSWR